MHPLAQCHSRYATVLRKSHWFKRKQRITTCTLSQLSVYTHRYKIQPFPFSHQLTSDCRIIELVRPSANKSRPHNPHCIYHFDLRYTFWVIFVKLQYFRPCNNINGPAVGITKEFNSPASKSWIQPIDSSPNKYRSCVAMFCEWRSVSPVHWGSPAPDIGVVRRFSGTCIPSALWTLSSTSYRCKSFSSASRKFTVYFTDLAIRIRISNVSFKTQSTQHHTQHGKRNKHATDQLRASLCLIAETSNCRW